jgi:uncharacterized membrane protein
MSYKTYRMWCGIIGMILGAVMAASLVVEKWMISVIAIAIAIVILTILRRRVKEIVADERTATVTGKAAQLSMQIAILGMALLGVIILAVNYNASAELKQVGFAFEYAACALMVINLLVYTYYDHKLGGKS